MADDKSGDLKARLGLKKRRKKVEEDAAAAAVKAEADAIAAKAAAKANAAQEIANARARAADADADAGPAAELFGIMGQENTPVPQRHEGPQYVVVEGSDEMKGQAKQRLMIIIGTAVVTFILAFFMGQMTGAAGAEQETLDLFAKQAAGKLANIQNAEVGSAGKTTKVLERIEALRAEFKTASVKIAGVLRAKDGGTDEEWKGLEPQLMKVIGVMNQYHKDKVFIDPLAMSGDLFTIGPVANFAMRTRRLYDKVGSAFAEAQSIAQVGSAMPDSAEMNRLVVTEVNDREVTQNAWWKTQPDGKRARLTECKDSKDCNDGFTCKEKKCFAPRVPERKTIAVVKSVPDIGRTQVGTVDPADTNSAPVYDWKMVVVTTEIDKKTKKPIVKVVSTKDVLQLDLTSAFTAQAIKSTALVTRRLAKIILESHALMEGIKWDKLEGQLKACANDKKCTFDEK